MESVNIHDAKTRFSQLVARAADGETVIIARAGRPVAQLSRVGAPSAPTRRGGLAGLAVIPDDFDDWAADQIARDFGLAE